MTQWRRTIAILLALTVLLISSGCSEAAFSEDALLRPPRPTGDKAEIQDIITAEAGGRYTLKYPQSGAYRSAITMKEYENKEISVALYSKEGSPEIYVSLISYSDNTWKCIGTYSSSAAGVDRLLFADINGDGSDELFIGWKAYTPDQFALTAYSLLPDSSYEMVIDNTYTELVLEDITGDSLPEIILLSLASQKKSASATVYQYSEQEKRPISRYGAELDPEITSFTNVSVGYIDKNRKGIVLDGEKSGDLISTQILYFSQEENQIVNPLLTQADNGVFSNPTTRKDTVISRDADNDGIIEVPVVTQMASSADEDTSAICSLTTWKQLLTADDTLTTKLSTVINYNDGYYFVMPENWKNSSVTALLSSDTRQLTFYVWNSKTTSRGDKLLVISRYTDTEWNEMDKTGALLLESVTKSVTNAVFAAELCTTESRDSLNLTKNQVLEAVCPLWVRQQ